MKDGEARLAQGNLAGSILTMDRAVRNMVGPAGAGLARALRMATRNPADSLGLSSMGRVAVGAAADLVLLDPDLQVERTLVQGRDRLPALGGASLPEGLRAGSRRSKRNTLGSGYRRST